MSSKKLLVVVDYQNDFVTGALANSAAEPLEDGIQKEVEKTLGGGGFVLFTRDTHKADYLQTREGKHLPVEHCIKGTNGHKLYGSLAKYEGCANDNLAIVDKPVFGSADLPKKVIDLCNGEPDSITICGVVTDICVISNAIILHSNFLNAHVCVRSDLCAAVTAEGHKNALAVMAGLGFEVKSEE